jgi:hypothetical protein
MASSNAPPNIFHSRIKKQAGNAGLQRSSGGLKIARMKQSVGHRIFLLSPAYAGGERARMILRDHAQFPLARRLRGKSGAPIADVFTFLSGLYFRGKIAYANAFARPVRGRSGVLVITPTRGLIDARTRIHLDDLREFAEVDIHEGDPRYRMPIERDARHLAKKLSAQSEVILLGSIATGKYVDVLLANFGQRLRFPADFVGRGDMSRGGLMLRCAVDRQELSYIPVAGAIVNGKRPPKLAPRKYSDAVRLSAPRSAKGAFSC